MVQRSLTPILFSSFRSLRCFRNFNRQSGYSFPRPPLAEEFPVKFILMNGFGTRNHGAPKVCSGSKPCGLVKNGSVRLARTSVLPANSGPSLKVSF